METIEKIFAFPLTSMAVSLLIEDGYSFEPLGRGKLS